MAYRIKLKEPMERAFVRICSEQIERACSDLATISADASLAIHSTRKCLKRTRAALRFFRPLLRPDDYAEANGGLREVGKALSATRDSDVLLQTIVKLQADNLLKPSVASRLSRAANAARATEAQSSDHASIASQSLRLEGLNLRLAAFRLDVELADERAIYTGGLERALDDCRDAFAVWSAGEEDPEALHEWRKSVQLHWRHMQLVKAAWPALCAARIEEARAISALTGACRDLSMLLDFSKTAALSAATVDAVASAVGQRVPELRDAARWRGERLLTEGPRGFCRRLEDYWKSARGLRKTIAISAPSS